MALKHRQSKAACVWSVMLLMCACGLKCQPKASLSFWIDSKRQHLLHSIDPYVLLDHPQSNM